MFYVYILQSKKEIPQKFYIGFTNDLQKRFKEHINGKVKSTQWKRPIKLMYYEAYQDEYIARKREYQLKHSAKTYTALKKRLKLL